MTQESSQAVKTASEKAKISLKSFYGRKAGMTRVFDENGNHISVTVVELIKNSISQVKTTEKDGYEAYQVAFNQKREPLVLKPTQGHLKKAGIEPVYTKFTEIKVEKVDPAALGSVLSYECFKPAAYVDVVGVTKGKGFQGVMKRFNYAGGPAAHGSMFHRRPGAIGNRATPARVFKLKGLPGHMGDLTQTVQNLVVVEVNLEKNYMLIRGSVPGARGALVKVSTARKKA